MVQYIPWPWAFRLAHNFPLYIANSYLSLKTQTRSFQKPLFGCLLPSWTTLCSSRPHYHHSTITFLSCPAFKTWCRVKCSESVHLMNTLYPELLLWASGNHKLKSEGRDNFWSRVFLVNSNLCPLSSCLKLERTRARERKEEEKRCVFFWSMWKAVSDPTRALSLQLPSHKKGGNSFYSDGRRVWSSTCTS